MQWRLLYTLLWRLPNMPMDPVSQTRISPAQLNHFSYFVPPARTRTTEETKCLSDTNRLVSARIRCTRKSVESKSRLVSNGHVAQRLSLEAKDVFLFDIYVKFFFFFFLQVHLLRKWLLRPDLLLCSSLRPFTPTDSKCCVSSPSSSSRESVRFLRTQFNSPDWILYVIPVLCREYFFIFKHHLRYVISECRATFYQFNKPFACCRFNVFFCLCSVNGQYMKQGKLGAAVLGNHTNKEVSEDLTLFSHWVAFEKLHLSRFPSPFLVQVAVIRQPAETRDVGQDSHGVLLHCEFFFFLLNLLVRSV